MTSSSGRTTSLIFPSGRFGTQRSSAVAAFRRAVPSRPLDERDRVCSSTMPYHSRHCAPSSSRHETSRARERRLVDRLCRISDDLASDRPVPGGGSGPPRRPARRGARRVVARIASKKAPGQHDDTCGGGPPPRRPLRSSTNAALPMRASRSDEAAEGERRGEAGASGADAGLAARLGARALRSRGPAAACRIVRARGGAAGRRGASNRRRGVWPGALRGAAAERDDPLA